MSVFEFVFGLFSIVVSLALTHLLAAVADLIRNRRRVRFSFVHALWMWSAFCVTIGNWAGMWAFRSFPAWPVWSILLMTLVVVACYFICYLVAPETRQEGPIDLPDFHVRERGSYLAAFLALSLLSLGANPIFHTVAGLTAWLRDSVIASIALTFVIAPMVFKEKWLQVVSAIITAALATYFMAASTNIAGT